MKAIILSAGFGSRLKPLTDTTPKCMIPINDKPVLQYNIENLKRYGIYDYIINLHYLPEKVTDYFGNGFKFGINIEYSYEDELLGTSGAVKKVQDKLGNQFLVVYGDNISTCNINRLWSFHMSHLGLGTIVLHRRRDTKNSGVVRFDENHRITSFIEKPKDESLFCNLVNSGMYLLDKKFLELIPDGYSDFGRDIFPKAIGLGVKLYGYPLFFFENLYWIDTIEDLEYTRMLLSDNSKSTV